LCRALDLPHLIDDSRFAKNDDRRVNKTQLIPILSAAFLTRTTDEWKTRLDAESVPWGPINQLDRVFADPQILARQMKIELEHPTIGKLQMLGNPVKVCGVDEKLAPPPLRGQHTAQILSKLLGYSPERIAELEKEQVI
jgi:crotonobetainyl-CoA:carnitine CoA-transferase CaiB-like acyl-CoA transferase